MLVAIGHKGKTGLLATCCGSEAHSALAPTALNAIHLAVDFINRLRERQALLATSGAADPAFDVPYTTVHVGKIAGGVALNIVPNRCTLEFEIRNLVADDPEDLIAAIRADADAIAGAARAGFAGAAIELSINNAYPGLDTPVHDAAVAFVNRLLGRDDLIKVAFGTEGGLIHRRLGVPTLVCGPGSMAQGHKADEFISRDQLVACDLMMDRLLDHLAA
jgi:acetylornithine deacetylase